MRNVFYIIVSGFFVFSTLIAESDIPRWKTESQLGRPLFMVSTHQRISDKLDKAGIDVSVEVMNDMLMFVRQESIFVASMEITLTITDNSHNAIVREVKHITKKVNDYNLTNSRRDFVVTVFSHELPFGKYNAKVQLEDNESRKRETVEEKVIAEKPKNEFVNISDLILCRSIGLDSTGHLPLYPTVSGIISDPSESLYCFFDLFRQNIAEACVIKLRVLDKSGALRHIDSLSIIGGGKLAPHFMKVPTTELTFNRYKAFLEVHCGGSILTRNVEFSINYHGLPWVIGDLDQAIEQMRYVAANDEIKRLKNEFPSRKEEEFVKFWDEKFPSENEFINGKMIEYYNRVQYTNMRFGNNRAGWESDRGRIYIIYGRPSEVEKTESDLNSVEYEIWYYNHLNKRFIFKDEFGFGEYRLVTTSW